MVAIIPWGGTNFLSDQNQNYYTFFHKYVVLFIFLFGKARPIRLAFSSLSVLELSVLELSLLGFIYLIEVQLMISHHPFSLLLRQEIFPQQFFAHLSPDYPFTYRICSRSYFVIYID